MDRIYILCLEDQREVLNSILEELEVFEEAFILEGAESAAEAEELVEEIYNEGDRLALVISDHIMPGKTGVDFLIDLKKDERFQKTRKILLTGLATHQDTIKAINQAGIDHYIEKPWSAEKLVAFTKELLTRFLLDSGIDYQPYLRFLDNQVLFKHLHQRQ
jgi:two-component system chemotaxis response regulator CheY